MVPAPRPAVDVVVPFAGSAAERGAALARMRTLALRDADTLTLVDNGAAAPPELDSDPAVVHAPGRATSYHARNAGAARGRAEWILFVDADVTPEPDLLDRYFDEAPGERTGVLAGAIRDESPADLDRLSPAARYAALRAPMSQENTLARGEWAYAQTANAAVRRAAFRAVDGFAEAPRSAGDAELCFRLRDAGWAIESRPGAVVTHHNRTTLRALARQRARHGAGVAWLNRAYPGFAPREPRLRWTVHKLAELARRRGDGPALTLVALVYEWAFAFGRLLPNEVPAREAR